MKNNLSLLIIEDSKLINNTLTKSLSLRGYNISQAFDIKSAKEILKKKSFDFALLDLELPDGIGEDLIPFFQIDENIRVIVMTSDDDKYRRENLFNYGVVIDYIIKDKAFADMELSIVNLIETVSTNHNINILVVDDSKFMRKQLGILLTKRGFNLYYAENGLEGLEVLKTHNIDSAIIDLEMPIMDGIKLLDAIRRDKENLLMPVMVVSSTSNLDKIAYVIKNGASDFIKKPYANEELLLKIDKMILNLKQHRLIKIHEAKFSMYNRAINKATIFFKLDKEFHITYANSTFNNLFFDDKDDDSNKLLEAFLSYSDKDEVSDLKDSLKAGRIVQAVFAFKGMDMHKIKLRLTFTPLLNELEEIDEVVVIGFDVSLLEEKEDVLKERIELATTKNWEQNKMLIQQSKMAAMGEMIGNIGHQWRQPLNSLAIMIQKINLEYELGKLNAVTMKVTTEQAMRLIDQMSHTIDDFSNFFSSDKKLIETNVSDIIKQTLSIVNQTAKSKGISINILAYNDILIKCLKNELSQVLVNVVTNAMDALISTQTKDPEINISVEYSQNDITIIVDDNAGGVPENIIERIFEPYFTTKFKNKGTGIGLYMSRTIIEENMGGSLEVYNSVYGASFKIIIPKNN